MTVTTSNIRIVRALPPGRTARANADPFVGGFTGGGGGFAFEADSLDSPELGDWHPWLRSPDGDTNFAGNRDRRVARTRHLVGNDGWARGGINRVLDNTIGSLFRLIARPDWRALRREAPGFDAQWAEDFAEFVESEFRLWADDPEHWCDATRKMSLVQMWRLQLRHKVIDGEDFGIHEWDPDTVGEGGARYATRLRLIDPDRLSNPYDTPDTHTMRGGVEIDNGGTPIAYHLRRAHQNDIFDASESMVWDRIARSTPWGRPIVVHDHDFDRAEQHRGVGALTSVLAGFKNLTRYDAAELGQALLQTSISTFVESPYDAEQVQMAMQGGVEELSAYQNLRSEYHNARGLSIGDVRIPMLVPGEKISFGPPRHPSQNFDAFLHAGLRKAASALGTTAEDITQDYSKANYSSLRAAMLNAWRTMVRRRYDFAVGTATPTYGAWLEEFIDRHPEALPRRAPSFMAARAAYMRCHWIGPGRGWIDPVKERQGAVLGLDAGFGTLRDECAEISGADWREQLDQRQVEVRAFKDRGLALPQWGASTEAAEDMAAKPQPA